MPTLPQRILLAVTAGATLTAACTDGNPSSSADTTTTTAASAAQDDQGYELRATGPAGGVVFYVAKEPFACGPDLSSSCTRLEVAPFAAEVELGWADPALTDVDVDGAHGSAIGTGWANTIAIVAAGNTDPVTSAAAYADAYEHGGKTDWYLPARDELHELTITREVIGGFTLETYWSSTQRGPDTAWYQNFLNGFQFPEPKSTRYWVRPVRAF